MEQPTKPACIRLHFAGPRAWFSIVVFNAGPGTLRLFFLVVYATHFGGFIIGLVAGITWKEFALDTDQLIAELTDEASS
jgi:membrane associated rhomboid family serine protease